MSRIRVDKIIVEPQLGGLVIDSYREAVILALTEQRDVQITLNDATHLISYQDLVSWMMGKTVVKKP